MADQERADDGRSELADAVARDISARVGWGGLGMLAVRVDPHAGAAGPAGLWEVARAWGDPVATDGGVGLAVTLHRFATADAAASFLSAEAGRGEPRAATSSIAETGDDARTFVEATPGGAEIGVWVQRGAVVAEVRLRRRPPAPSGGWNA